MNTERDKFLTEAMGEQWHENTGEVAGNNVIGFTLCSCGKWWGQFGCLENTNFSTWPGFGKLWEWAGKQGFWLKMMQRYQQEGFYHYIHPDRLADDVYEFLKQREG